MKSAADILQKIQEKRKTQEVKINCEKHGESIVRKITYGGNIIQHPVCHKCLDEKKIAEQSEQIRLDEQERINRNIAGINIYPRFESYSFENYDNLKFKQASYAANIAKKYCVDFEERLKCGRNLLFHGGIGTGKTFFSIAIAKKAVQSGYSAKYIEMPTVYRYVKSQFKFPDFSEQRYIDSLCEPDFLVIDELGISFGSDFEKSFIFSLINKRYNLMKPVIAISNLCVEDLKNTIGARVVDRLIDKGVTVNFDWGSLRGR